MGCEGHEEGRGEQREEGALQEGVLPAVILVEVLNLCRSGLMFLLACLEHAEKLVVAHASFLEWREFGEEVGGGTRMGFPPLFSKFFSLLPSPRGHSLAGSVILAPSLRVHEEGASGRNWVSVARLAETSTLALESSF